MEKKIRIRKNPQGKQDDLFKQESRKNITLVPAPVDKLGLPGRWLRNKLLDSIHVGTPVVEAIQKHRTPGWTIWMKSASFLGTEDFYTIMFVLLLWIFDSRFARLFCLLMGVGFYLTGFLKTSLCLPRPPLATVVPLEKAFDWALPSHHSLLGTILPWYIWLYINIHYKLSTFQLAFLFFIIFLWSFNVLFSRCYLGVHSPADVVSGGIVGMVILFIWVPVDDVVDHFISRQSSDVIIQVAILFALLVIIHPSSDPGNPSLRDSCILVGTCFGLIWGHSQRNNPIGHPALLETILPGTPLSTIIGKSLARIVLGSAFIFITRVVIKKTLYMFFEIMFKVIGLPFYSGKMFRRQGLVLCKHFSEDFKIEPIDRNSETKVSKQEVRESMSANLVLSDEEIYNMQNNNDLSEVKYDNLYSLWQQRNIAEKSHTSEINLPTLPWDIDVFVTLSLYPILTYCAFEYLPRLFLLCNI